jgi:hypothetical protein
VARAPSAIALELPLPRKWLAFESQYRGSPFNPFTLKFSMFVEVSGFEHGLRRGKEHPQPSPSAPWQFR